MSADMCKIALGLYVFPGEEVTNSFNAKGKIGGGGGITF